MESKPNNKNDYENNLLNVNLLNLVRDVLHLGLYIQDVTVN